MNYKKTLSFIVDLSQSMVVKSKILEKKDEGQLFFCKCGNKEKISSKVVRNIIKNYDEITEDSESLKLITCKKCNTTYDDNEQLYLLEKDIPFIYFVEYKTEFIGKNTFLIYKEKKMAIYNPENGEIEFFTKKDYISFDLLNKKIILEIKKPLQINNNIYKLNENDNLNTISFNDEIDISNVRYLDDFFSYSESVNYCGFEEISKSLNFLKTQIKDLEKFESIHIVDFIKEKNDVLLEFLESGEIKYFKNIESGFGDGKLIKKRLNIGDYLFNTLSSYKLIVSLISFENASCIIHTKGFEFFKQWRQSNFVLKPEVYRKYNATNPNSIIEVSINYNDEGKRRDGLNLPKSFKQEKLNPILKISNTIFSSIKKISNLNTLSDCNVVNFIKKENIEFLFQNYDNNRVYFLMNKFIKSSYSDIKINFKNFKHILDTNMDLDSRFDIFTYIDTLRVIDLLEIKDKIIFKCKNYHQLKKLHDNYTSRYNAIKDAKKSEIYKKTVSEFKKLNTQIGDVKFEVVESSEKLNLEGLEMNHCIYTYLDRICEKKYLAININHILSGERATAGFIVEGEELFLEQLKGYYNSRATKEIIDVTLEFCLKNKINITKAYESDITPDKTKQRQISGQISEEKLNEIRVSKEQEEK